ncbi:hypothetical protein [Haloglomus litoreum]|uniref:hypothetical protein n=1 Tax=Haloglomus litoreum TaxID=3034026 RepID=UPI0023E85B5F|nr:hypothetical protein [Haloglomus sp. DT116]
MSRPPVDPRDRPLPPRTSPQSVPVSWAMMAAVVLLVWGVSYPQLGVLTAGALGALAVVRSHIHRLARCVSECRRLTISLGRHGHITVSRERCCRPD